VPGAGGEGGKGGDGDWIWPFEEDGEDGEAGGRGAAYRGPGTAGVAGGAPEYGFRDGLQDAGSASSIGAVLWTIYQVVRVHPVVP
jgi:hypothetical protein